MAPRRDMTSLRASDGTRNMSRVINSSNRSQGRRDARFPAVVDVTALVAAASTALCMHIGVPAWGMFAGWDRVRDWRGWRQSDTVLRLIEMRIADGQHRLLLRRCAELWHGAAFPRPASVAGEADPFIERVLAQIGSGCESLNAALSAKELMISARDT